MRKLLIGIVAVCCWAGAALGGEAAPTAADPALEARVNKLAEELRCLVCQNQSIAESHADLAMDLKNEVREMLRRGMSERQVVDFLVQRYGDFVLYRPPLKRTTWLLWAGPFLLLVAALAALYAGLRRPSGAPLTTAEHEAAAALLRDEGKQP